MHQRSALKSLALVLAAGFMFTTLPTFAQQKKLVLRVADQLPQGHFLSKYGVKPWMEYVTNATNGEVQFEYYPAEQLGKAKDMLSIVQTGVADAAIVAPAYITDKMPLSAGLELPGLFGTSCQGSQALSKLAAPDAILGRQEYGPNGVRALFTVTYPPYKIASTKRKIESSKDMEGLKLRTLGGAMDLAVRRLKGVSVKMSSPDLFEAVTRGTVDGAMLSYGVTVNYNIPAKFVTVGPSMGSPIILFAVGENRWKQLPEHVKKAMTEAGVAVGTTLCAEVDKEEAGDLDKLRSKGVTVVRWSDAAMAEMDTVLADVGRDWATELDKRGKPASDVLKAVLQARDGR